MRRSRVRSPSTPPIPFASFPHLLRLRNGTNVAAPEAAACAAVFHHRSRDHVEPQFRKTLESRAAIATQHRQRRPAQPADATQRGEPPAEPAGAVERAALAAGTLARAKP